MVATVIAPYFLLTADYRSEPNALDPFVDVETMVSPTIFVRHCLSYLMSDKPQEALNDAMQAQVVFSVWHIVSYLQDAALSALGMDSEVQAVLVMKSA